MIYTFALLPITIYNEEIHTALNNSHYKLNAKQVLPKLNVDHHTTGQTWEETLIHRKPSVRTSSHVQKQGTQERPLLAETHTFPLCFEYRSGKTHTHTKFGLRKGCVLCYNQRCLLTGKLFPTPDMISY